MLKITIFETETNQNIQDQFNHFLSIKSFLQYMFYSKLTFTYAIQIYTKVQKSVYFNIIRNTFRGLIYPVYMLLILETNLENMSKITK